MDSVFANGGEKRKKKKKTSGLFTVNPDMRL